MNQDRALAIKTLREICNSDSAPMQAKATAARTLLEMLGDIGRLQQEKTAKENKSLHMLSKSELDEEIARMGKGRRTKPGNGVTAAARR
jgi:hypothetical protein